MTLLQRAKPRCPSLPFVSLSRTLTPKLRSICLGNSRLLANGVCEAADKVIETDRNRRVSRKLHDDPALMNWVNKGLDAKNNVIAELTERIFEWNHTKCPKCHASLKGTGPQVPTEQEVRSYNDQAWSYDESESSPPSAQDKHSEAEIRLREILAKSSSQKGKFLRFA